MAPRKISYIFPIFNEEGNIDLLYERMCAVTTSRAEQFDAEFIFVDDGSRDRSLEMLNDLAQRDERVRVYSLSRNYGHQIAVTAGLDVADGDAVIIMDSDLQDPPEVSLELIDKWLEGYDVVYAQRRSRKDTLFKRATAHAYYWTLDRLASVKIPRNTGDFRLIDRRVVLELRKYREHSRFLRGLIASMGYRQVAVPFDRDARHAGETGYSMSKMLQLASDGIIGFSAVPLRMISRMGMVLAGVALIGMVYLAVQRIINPQSSVQGWTFVVVAMLLLGGIQIIMLGVLGTYLGRIYLETQARPLYAFAQTPDSQIRVARLSTDVASIPEVGQGGPA